MTTQNNQNERLLKFLQASPEMQAEIDRILEGKVQTRVETSTGPLLCGMSPGAKFLGVSRATLWRMIKAGRLSKVEILPGSYRVRRADLEAIAAGTGSEGMTGAHTTSARLRCRRCRRGMTEEEWTGTDEGHMSKRADALYCDACVAELEQGRDGQPQTRKADDRQQGDRHGRDQVQ